MKRKIIIAIAFILAVFISFRVGQNYQRWQDTLLAAKRLSPENFKQLYNP